EEFWNDVKVPGDPNLMNPELEKAGRVADYLELAELMARDALHRKESCGGHFREESQTEENEAKRDDTSFSYVAAWEHQGEGKAPEMTREPLEFERIHLATRSYK
ncbi:MAG: fumarate reductase/succinate dehydrogenase flavoprotein subunit, partial [Oligoflexia bacterium]|nr:fumarate reductase/succinate dehydrogenase flavoprotein subunit [Oligoflexia bacterium]